MSYFASSLSSQKSGFTLIELMIVISIIGILAMIVGAPYSYLSDKQRLNTQKFRLEQLIAQARSEARNGALFPGVSGSPDEMSSIAIRIKPTDGANKAKIDYLRYRPSASVDEYKTCADATKCVAYPVQLVDQKIQLSILDAAGVPQTSTGYIIFTAPNALGSTTLPQSKLRIQMGNDPTLIKDLTIKP